MTFAALEDTLKRRVPARHVTIEIAPGISREGQIGFFFDDPIGRIAII